MFDEHKSAIADWTGGNRCGAGLPRSTRIEPSEAGPQGQRRAGMDAQFDTGDLKLIKRLELVPQRRGVDAQLEATADEPDMRAVENRFIKRTAGYGQRKGTAYAPWRKFGVPADVLAKAAISRGK